ncbi:MAG: hypothetical protein DMG09_07090, partial [Acidobacteria bacterium]
SDWGYLTAFFFADAVPFDPAKLELKGKTREDLVTVLQLAVWRLEQAREFSAQGIENIFNDLARKFELKLRDMTRPFYIAITGSEASTPLFQSMAILGSDLVRMRLRRALEALGGISSKKLKEMEKLFESFYGPLA